MNNFTLRVLLLFSLVIQLNGVVTAPDLRGAMIQRIATFIEWQKCGAKNITIGVYDDPKSSERFKRLYEGQHIDDNAIVVRSYDRIEQLDTLNNCDILYMGDVSMAIRTQIIQKLSRKGVLLIGNTRDDARSGIAIVLLEDGGRYKILINQEALKASNLRADYRLLKLAELVSGY
jgi:hypothetical protein